MWWKWTIFIVCGIMILACVISTTIDWISGKTGPFGPRAIDWWGCGIFTVIVAAIMFWMARLIFG